MTHNLINSDNWTYCHYASSDQKALITLGGHINDGQQVDMVYHVTVMDNEDQEVFQMDFKKLETACNYINRRYQDMWNMVDATQKSTKDGGCSSCVAH